MLKKLNATKQDIIKMLVNTRAAILPFCEQPAPNKDKDHAQDHSSELNAADLFSLFTAGIIKENVIFSR